MDAEYLLMQLKGHEQNSQQRFEILKESIDKQSVPHDAEKEHKMTEPVHIKNIFEPGHGGGMAGVLPYLGAGGWGGTGAGLGAGLLGGVLGGALLGGRGLFGGRDGEHCGEGCVTPTQLTAGLAGVIDSQQNTAVLQGIGDIKAAVPLAEAQMQLALAGSTNTITKSIADSTAALLASECSIKEAVASYGTANLAATKDSQYALSVAINADGEKTRALITQQYEANLQRQLAVAEAALAEQRSIGRSREVEVNVSQSVNQNQLQLQQQQQQQQQLVLLSQIAHGLANVTQIAHATNSNIIAGNTGAVATGPQTANPVNVNA